MKKYIGYGAIGVLTAAIIALAVSALFWTPAGPSLQAPAFTAAPADTTSPTYPLTRSDDGPSSTSTDLAGIAIVDTTRPSCPPDFHCGSSAVPDYYVTQGGETALDVVRMYVATYHINAEFEPCVFDPDTEQQLHPADDQPLPAGLHIGLLC